MLQASNPKDLGLLPDRLDRIGEFIQRKYIDTGLLPHGALLIGRGDEIAHLWTSGVEQDAIFRIASMTKPVTSVALMQLMEQGLVGLLNPVSDYLPEFANIGVYEGGGGATPFITRPPKTVMRVVDLLRHTAGFTYSFQEMGYVDAAYRRTEVENWSKVNDQDFIDILAGLPIEFDPGTEWNYSIATDILGVIVARVSGLPLGDYFQQHIFGPLGMVDTGFQVPADQAHRLPPAYVFHPKEKLKLYDKGGAESGWARPRNFHSGGGGLASTLSDYNRFCRMLLNGGALDGVQILSPKTLELMTANHLPGGGDLTQHSRALFSEAENGGIGFGLGFACNIDPAATASPGSKGEFFWGGMFSTAFLVDPVEHLTMVFMTQLMPSTTYPIRREIRALMYAALAA